MSYLCNIIKNFLLKSTLNRHEVKNYFPIGFLYYSLSNQGIQTETNLKQKGKAFIPACP